MKLDSDKATKGAFDRIRTIIGKFGPRLCGDESTHKAVNFIAEDLKQYTSDVFVEDFQVNPLSFLGWIKVTNFLHPLIAILAWLNMPILAFLISIIPSGSFLSQTIFYTRFMESFYPEKTGKNVYGIIEPTEKATKTIIFSGHHDSAYRFGYYEHLPNLAIPRAAMNLLIVLGITVCTFIEIVLKIYNGISLLSIFNTNYSHSTKVINWIITLTLPGTLTAWNYILPEGSLGAGDNLISTSIGIELAKYFSENKLKNTRVIIASFDGEECGLRGSSAFFKKHAEELKQIPTHHFNVDSPFFLNEFVLLTADINGFVKLDPQFAESIASVGKSIGVSCKTKPLPFLLGGTDSAESARVGISATTLVGLPWRAENRVPVYHTHYDTPEAIEPEAVNGVIRLAANYIESVDGKSE